MKDIKTKEQDRNPKVRNPVSRLPKELVRSSVPNAKEKSAMLSDHVGRDTGQESPTEYAGNRLESAEYRVGSETASAVVLLWSSIFVTLMANKIGGLQFGIYRNCQISSRVFHTAVAALPLTKANRSDFE